MKKLAQKLNVEWVLRASLGLMYFYSGIDLIRHPTAWYWAVRPLPTIVQNVINKIGIEQYLRFQGVGELALAAVLLFKFMPRVLVILVAGLMVLEMAAILLFVGVDAITFRDIGLLGAALALYVILAGNGSARLPARPAGGPDGQEKREEKKSILTQPKPDQPVVETYDQFMKK